jgi:hypothetical protein
MSWFFFFVALIGIPAAYFLGKHPDDERSVVDHLKVAFARIVQSLGGSK